MLPVATKLKKASFGANWGFLSLTQDLSIPIFQRRTAQNLSFLPPFIIFIHFCFYILTFLSLKCKKNKLKAKVKGNVFALFKLSSYNFINGSLGLDEKKHIRQPPCYFNKTITHLTETQACHQQTPKQIQVCWESTFDHMPLKIRPALNCYKA